MHLEWSGQIVFNLVLESFKSKTAAFHYCRRVSDVVSLDYRRREERTAGRHYSNGAKVHPKRGYDQPC